MCNNNTKYNFVFYGYVWTPKHKHIKLSIKHFRSFCSFETWYKKDIQAIVKGSALYYANEVIGLFDDKHNFKIIGV